MKFVYTSSTSVYGQTDGSVVTETSPTKPQSDAAKILVGTEKLLLEAVRERGFPAVILRVSGIYGPERGYWLKQFVSGEARMDGSGERILNMVHRDDVVGSIVAALEDGEPGEVYNVSDDEPVSQQVLFEWLAQKLGKPMPPIAEEERRTPQKREVTNKKVSNARLKTDLGYQIKYPTFREGFGALLG
jgi:nucleoside-diphosphate-sugar epimerase